MRVVSSYLKPEEAHLMRTVLEGSGIRAYVRDDLTIIADLFYSNALGGVRLEVADDDYTAACDVLRNSKTTDSG